MKFVEINIQNERVQGFVETVASTTWIHINGKTIALETSSGKSRRRKVSAGGLSPEIIAPMPGKMTSIKMKVGDLVKPGDVVLVMEAMKMEYSLKAQMAGTLKNILCTEQQQVTLGQKLAEIEAEPSTGAKT